MRSKSYDTLAYRLALILRYFNDGETLEVKALAEEFGVTERTIQKDLNGRLAFLPIVGEDGRYTMQPYALGKFSPKDLRYFALFCGLGGLYSTLDQSMIVDILNERINHVLSIKGYAYEDISDKQTLFEHLGASIAQNHRVAFVYKEKQRVVEPYKLRNIDGVWYLIAVESTILKTFSLRKIEAFKPLKESFTPDSQILHRIETHEGSWFGTSEIEVTLRIDACVAEYFLRRDILPYQKILDSDTRRLLLSCKVAYEEEILRLSRFWIPHIIILSPSSLQAKLDTTLQSYLQSDRDEIKSDW